MSENVMNLPFFLLNLTFSYSGNIKGIVMFQSKSKLPVILTSIYIVISILAFILMFATMATESLSGIFVVLVAMPWTILFTPIIDAMGLDSIALNTVFMALGVILNALLIYSFFSFVTRKNKRNTPLSPSS